MNFALLLPSSAILLYILITYVTGDILLLFLNSRQITDTLLLIASSIFYLLCALVLRQVLKSIIQRVNISQKLIWLSTILSSLTFISYFVIIAIERLTDEESAMGKANSFFIIGYGLISAGVFLVLLYSFQKDYTTKEKQREMEYLKDYTSQLEKNYMEIRRFRHDYQNIMLSLEEYIQEENIPELKNYFYTKLKKTSEILESNNFKLSQLSNIMNSELKSLFSNKLTISQELGINTEIEVNEKIDVPNVDSILLVRSFGIILDNAIEAASGEQSGFVRAAMFKDENKLKIIVENSCSKELPKLFLLKKEGFSTKGKNRGMGLSNLERLIAGSKDIILDTKIENGTFFQILTIGE